MLTILLIAQLLPAFPVGLSVRVDPGPDPCGLHARALDALRKVLPGMSVEAEVDATRSRRKGQMRLVLTPRPRGFELALLDETGRRVLERTLANLEGECAGTADGIGLIVERYLRELGYLPTTPTTPTTPERGPPRDTLSSGEGSPSSSSTEAAEAPRSPKELLSSVTSSRALGGGKDAALSLELGAVAETEVSLSPVRATAGAGLLARLGIGSWEISALAGGTLPSREVVLKRNQPLGEIRVASVSGSVGLGACLAVQPARICGVGRFGLERHRGSTRDAGDRLFREIGRSRTGVLLILEGRLDLRATERLIVRAGTGLLVRPAPLVFEVEGTSSAYTVPQVAPAFSLGAVVTVF